MCSRFTATFVFSISVAGALAAADPPPVLHLINNSQVSGSLLASDNPANILWRSPAFAAPLEFPMNAVEGIHYTGPMSAPNPLDEFGFELIDGDFLYGNLLALTNDTIELESTRLGRIRLQREQVRRFFRSKGTDAVYLGPNGLLGWIDWATQPHVNTTARRVARNGVEIRQDPPGKPQWREEGGQIFTDQKGASLFADLGIPDKAMIEAEISWRVTPDFTFALGVDAQDTALKNAFRFEVWNGELVVVGESPRDADMAIVEPAGAIGGKVWIQLYLDQPQRKLILVSRTGKTLATLKIAGGKAELHRGVRLINGKGDVRLEHLRVTRWNGVSPPDVRDDQPRFDRADGSILNGQLVTFDAAGKRFTIREGGKEIAVSKEEIANIYLGSMPPAGKNATDAVPPRTLRIDCRDGSRLSGVPSRIEEGHVTLTCPGVKDAVRVPLADIRSLIPLRHGAAAAGPPQEGRSGRLEIEGLSLKGRIAPPVGRADAGNLAWQPDLGLNASTLVSGFSGRIVFRDPPPPPPPAPPTQPQDGGMVMAPIVGFFNRASQGKKPSAPQAKGSGQPSLHLRTGDTIPCEVTRIDEKGVTFKAPNTDSTFVPHEKIKSIELIATRDAPTLDDIKRNRLLTLPRMQRDSPPTHLICSKTGDFLRGRIVEMDEDTLKVEVRLEVKEIPRDRVAQIIWLHADELADAKSPPPVPAASQETRVQTIDPAGNRLTFVLRKADGKTISGVSDVLGACRADLANVDEVLFGSGIEQSAAKLAFHIWKLHHAVDPKFVQGDAGGGDGGPTGTESALVGQPAPPFQLDALDGSKFKLADHKGHVVVLDFWATWCGPCMQSMPLVEEVIGEFADRRVELLAVNMEERPDQVKSMLERHKLKPPVAIDIDGAVAAKYAVTAIPQTVVIDSDGKVARLFVGGGKSMADALRKSLQELTAKPQP